MMQRLPSEAAGSGSGSGSNTSKLWRIGSRRRSSPSRENGDDGTADEAWVSLLLFFLFSSSTNCYRHANGVVGQGWRETEIETDKI